MENIKLISVELLKDSEYNPRQITKDELKKLENSIKEFGLVQPIVVNIHPARENIVISGHQRLQVAKKLGMKEVPCMLVDLDLSKERALNLAMNKIGGRFEEDKLIDLLSLIEEENDCKMIFKLKEIYGLMESITDRCQEVAFIVEGIVLEHA